VYIKLVVLLRNYVTMMHGQQNIKNGWATIVVVGRLRVKAWNEGKFALLVNKRWSQWTRGLRRGSTTSRLLGMWIRIPPVAWMFVSCQCRVLSCLEFFACGLSHVQRSPADCDVSKWNRWTSQRKPRLTRAVEPSWAPRYKDARRNEGRVPCTLNQVLEEIKAIRIFK
jgi:hypothetical protein